MKNLFAMAIPILPGKTEQWKKFANELTGKYYDAFVASRKKLNVHERTFLQHSPQGDFVLVTLEGDDPQNAFKNFANGNDEFTNWFVKEVKEIHGFDLKNPPQGPLPELVIDSREQVMHN
ncbi:MAG: hypothetical protein ABI723_26880 [Bacteroidia bacterium]